MTRTSDRSHRAGRRAGRPILPRRTAREPAAGIARQRPTDIARAGGRSSFGSDSERNGNITVGRTTCVVIGDGMMAEAGNSSAPDPGPAPAATKCARCQPITVAT